MQTIKRPAEFTGYVVLRHRDCKAVKRVYVGKHFFNGYGPDDKTKIYAYDWSQQGGKVVKLPWGHAIRLSCPVCGRDVWNLELHARGIYGSYVEEKICDGRCMGATGPTCECSCGGLNHGRNHGR